MVGSAFWCVIICTLLTFAFGYWGSALIHLISDIPQVREEANVYLPWLVAMPLSSMWCFLLDGIFIGATKGKEMRNSMVISTTAFFSMFYLFSQYGNHALWLAMLSFMIIRGLSLAMVLAGQWKRGVFFA
jgi:MATE family multidrug resistance protein